MCSEQCREDPRDAVAYADSALTGVCVMLNQHPVGETISAHTAAAVLGVISDRLAPAVEALQKYVPRPPAPPHDA